jgi:hypothetical protein
MCYIFAITDYVTTDVRCIKTNICCAGYNIITYFQSNIHIEAFVEQVA